jgi:sugar transferase (PEP-CTERM/EpsH1 system associated)
MSPAPRIVHVIHRLDVGGLENGLVNLINHCPPERFRHAIVCVTQYSDFRKRIRAADVPIIALQKKPGHEPAVYRRFWRALDELKPQIVHTRNLGTLEYQWVAAAARIKGRVHGEHGWDTVDLHGDNPRYRLLRRVSKLAVHRYIPMSRHLEEWLQSEIHIPPERLRRVYNGVDAQRFHVPAQREPLERAGFADPDAIVIGTAGRLAAVKNQRLLIEAFRRLVHTAGERGKRLRLVIVGDGEQRAECQRLIEDSGIAAQSWITGLREDVPQLLRGFDVFALPSLNEGISNTILEAMATGLPVVATRVGGNAELVTDGLSGALCDLDNADAFAAALGRYAFDPELRRAHGAAGRRRVDADFGIESMVRGYLDVYDRLLS